MGRVVQVVGRLPCFHLEQSCQHLDCVNTHWQCLCVCLCVCIGVPASAPELSAIGWGTDLLRLIKGVALIKGALFLHASRRPFYEPGRAASHPPGWAAVTCRPCAGTQVHEHNPGWNSHNLSKNVACEKWKWSFPCLRFVRIVTQCKVWVTVQCSFWTGCCIWYCTHCNLRNTDQNLWPPWMKKPQIQQRPIKYVIHLLRNLHNLH